MVWRIGHNKGWNNPDTMALPLVKMRIAMPARSDKRQDPRSTAEKARADLKANTEMGLAPPESPVEQKPSVRPETFGEGRGFKDNSNEDALSRAKE